MLSGHPGGGSILSGINPMAQEVGSDLQQVWPGEHKFTALAGIHPGTMVSGSHVRGSILSGINSLAQEVTSDLCAPVGLASRSFVHLTGGDTARHHVVWVSCKRLLVKEDRIVCSFKKADLSEDDWEDIEDTVKQSEVELGDMLEDYSKVMKGY